MPPDEPPLQTWPAMPQLLAPGGGAHVPSVAPAALVQVPLQHEASLAQTSPVCVQNEGCP